LLGVAHLDRVPLAGALAPAKAKQARRSREQFRAAALMAPFGFG